MSQLRDADKQTLISWIHRFDRKKRTYAIITEQFFERKLAFKVIAGLCLTVGLTGQIGTTTDYG